MPNYEIQIPIPLNTYIADDNLKKNTKLEDLINYELENNGGKIIKKYETSLIVYFNLHKNAKKFNDRLHYWLNPRMFLDTNKTKNRYIFLS